MENFVQITMLALNIFMSHDLTVDLYGSIFLGMLYHRFKSISHEISFSFHLIVHG